jgi:hypothetical protein
VKKVQHSFVVEYKSGRPKLHSGPNSIWGDIDIKSIAQDLQDELVPLLPQTSQVSRSESSSPEQERAAVLLTLPDEQETTASALPEITMADENNTMTDANTPAMAALDAPRKERKPRRTNRVAGEIASAAVSVQPAVDSDAAAGTQKRGRKPKSGDVGTSVKRAAARRAPKNSEAAVTLSMVAVDEFADLVRLEAENQKLRKLLAEKLRAENADLRKRLNLS